MATLILLTVIGAAAIAFLIAFFIALCNEHPSGKCQAVAIVQYEAPAENSERDRYFAKPGEAEWGC